MLRCVGWDPAQTLGVVGDPSATTPARLLIWEEHLKPRRGLVDLVSLFVADEGTVFPR